MTRNAASAVWMLTTVLFVGAADGMAFAQGSLPAGWSDTDIGDVGQPGSGFQSDDTFHVSGAGSDIWGTADSFHFTYTHADGDGDIAVKVTGQSATDPFAKAGVMLRQSLLPGSPMVIFDVKPDGSTELMMRSVEGGNTVFIASTPGPMATWVHLTRVGEYVAAFTADRACSMGCGKWTMVSNGWLHWVGGPVFMGLAVTSHDSSTLNSATLDFWEQTSLSSPWNESDSYFEATPDNATSAQGGIVVRASGSDIWGAADSFKFVWQSGSNDQQIVVRVGNMFNHNGGPLDSFAKAGVMMRADLGASSANVVLDVKPDGGVEFMKRASPGAETEFLAGGFMPLPAWLKLVRVGNQISGYQSNDGQTWTLVGETTVSAALPRSRYYTGLAATSHDLSSELWATFDSVALTPALGENLVKKPGFEEYAVGMLGAPGWVSDPIRQAPATTEAAFPHTGAHNGACHTNQPADCGIYQDVIAPATTLYTAVFFATTDRPGGLVGVNVNGPNGRSGGTSTEVEPRGFGNYGSPYTLTFFANAGDTIRVWMYASSTPTYVVIDDVSLSVSPEVP